MPPPSFDSLDYWDTRFQKDPHPFDWLLPSAHLHPFLRTQIPTEPAPNLLHIGCGTSTLSSHLRALAPAARICNVDYSAAAVRAGKAQNDAGGSSRWEVLDLLCAARVRAFAEGGTGWDVVVDKSTCDAIACGEDVGVRYRPAELVRLHPVAVLAVHLAFLVRGGGKWLVCSYSSERFPFWREGRAEGEGLGGQGEWLRGQGLHPGDLWKLEGFEGVVKREEARDGVHRPPEMCYLYTLVRTGVEVKSI